MRWIIETTEIVNTSHLVIVDGETGSEEEEERALTAFHSGEGIEVDQWIEQQRIGDVYPDG